MAISGAICGGCADSIVRAEVSVTAKKLFILGWIEWSACSEWLKTQKKTRANWKDKGLQAVGMKWQVMNSEANESSELALN